jgi:hypothetical protein
LRCYLKNEAALSISSFALRLRLIRKETCFVHPQRLACAAGARLISVKHKVRIFGEAFEGGMSTGWIDGI